MLTKSCEKVAPDFCCITCNYTTSRKSSYDKHLMTSKHNKLTSVNIKVAKSCKTDELTVFKCDICYKEFFSRVGLWKHKKKCCNENISINDSDEEHTTAITEPTDKDLIMLLIKENSELKNLMMEVIKSGTHNTNNNTNNNITNNNNNINSHNKTFNLNVFLNETCKDAMNINDFIESIQLQVSDLINVGEVGFVEGISNIIVKNLNKLDITQRPVHCTDKKREVVYIKDDDKWEKDDEQKKKLRKVIKKVSFKNEKMLFKYKEKYPDCIDSKSRRSDQYNKIIIEAMGGEGDNDAEKEDKIIRNITKNITIDKEKLLT